MTDIQSKYQRRIFYVCSSYPHKGSPISCLIPVCTALILFAFATQANARPTQQLTYPLKINFQDDTEPAYADYRVDGGALFGDRGGGYFYGWDTDITGYARNRNNNRSANEAYDTLVHMSYNDGLDATWEIELPNGDYLVQIALGDPSYTNSVYDLQVEGVTLVNGTPTSSQRWLEVSARVTVNDGRLTLSNGASTTYQKINFIEIEQAPLTTIDFTQPVNINFQPSDVPPVAGYLVDSGDLFAQRVNGHRYGWSENTSRYTRDRNSNNSPNEAYDTLIHMSHSSGLNASWELELPNGDYLVTVAMGDPAYTNRGYNLEIEGGTVVQGNTSRNQRWFEVTARTTISDGRLTLSNGSGVTDQKISFITIEPAPPVVIDYTQPIRINFQPNDTPAVSGYLADGGDLFTTKANGYSYGWDEHIARYTRDRNSNRSPEEIYDTLIHMSYRNGLDATWEFELPNGAYTVTLTAGDPSYTSSIYDMQLEGQTVLSVACCLPFR
ncbi:MAG: hypothetical protein F6K62_26045 [Sphaerospermopsis sp. SIO1G2]|nr:hypothetical protein [Sphaerospermopsis sp. SIO1G2]